MEEEERERRDRRGARPRPRRAGGRSARESRRAPPGPGPTRRRGRGGFPTRRPRMPFRRRPKAAGTTTSAKRRARATARFLTHAERAIATSERKRTRRSEPTRMDPAIPAFATSQLAVRERRLEEEDEEERRPGDRREEEREDEELAGDVLPPRERPREVERQGAVHEVGRDEGRTDEERQGEGEVGLPEEEEAEELRVDRERDARRERRPREGRKVVLQPDDDEGADRREERSREGPRDELRLEDLPPGVARQDEQPRRAETSASR